MPPFFRALRLFSILIFASAIHLRAQDMALRVEAVRLLERSNAVSRSTRVLPNRKLDVTFRAYTPDGIAKDGTYGVIYAIDSERYETHFGDYNAISIHLPDKIVQSEFVPPPIEALEVHWLTPLVNGRFDESDTITSITPATLFGRRGKCIQFETVKGRSQQSNEICLDEELGAIVRWHLGEDLIENTDYFSFEGVLFPAHMRHYVNGTLRMELDQKFTVIEAPIDWAALTPPNARTILPCTQYRRPIVQSAPQPPSAGPGPWYDVQVHGSIGSDGHVHNPTAMTAGKPDLEKQAVQIVSSWVYSPPTCDGKPTSVSADFIVHFPPQ
jgi:hypothetical protein